MNYKKTIIKALIKVITEYGYTTSIQNNRDIHEQSLTHRLAYHIENSGYFSDFNIDCEYNRYEDTKKRNSSGELFKPDILVHIRGIQEGNQIIIEAKKFNDTSTEIEKTKIDLLSNKISLSYKFAYLVIFPKTINDLDENSVIEI